MSLWMKTHGAFGGMRCLVGGMLLSLITGCSTLEGHSDETPTDGDLTPDAEDSSPTPVDPASLCGDAPVVTWDNFGQGFMIENCQSRHATTSPNRYGASPDVHFDTLDDVLERQDRILARAAGENPTMPPDGGVSADDRWLLQVWLTCWQ